MDTDIAAKVKELQEYGANRTAKVRGDIVPVEVMPGK